MDRVEINKLLDSLEYIKLTCLNMETCVNCPLRLRNQNECYVMDIAPRYWVIKQKDEKWSAFDD